VKEAAKSILKYPKNLKLIVGYDRLATGCLKTPFSSQHPSGSNEIKVEPSIIPDPQVSPYCISKPNFDWPSGKI
jgi:hypothetical protein